MGIFSDINGNIVRLHPGELYNSGLEFFADKKMHFILVGRWIVTISIHIYKYIYISKRYKNPACDNLIPQIITVVARLDQL